ncbi:P-type ATPase [Trema orientale]|uniref:P-type ATPase n=1 Tax=Trema orientale TaxID=63057 RepID=A0A2P5EXJ1_TREOI|nr:P-type ATPase [Trema orientale]
MKQRGKISTNIISVLTVILVGIVEGIPIVITFALVYLRKKVLSNKASDPGLLATVTMGSVTTIWIDKSTLNPSDVAMCFVGTEEVIQSATLDIAKMPELVREALGNGISAPLMMPSSPRKVAPVTEDPLLPWANSNLGIKLDNLRQSSTIIKAKGLSSNEEGSSVLMKNTGIKSLHLKGPAITILRKCSSYYNAKGETNVLDEDKRQNFERNIEMMQSQSLKTIAFACKHIHSPDVEENDLIVIAMVGLKKNACCAKMKETLKAFQDAEVKIRLVSEDGVSELKEIAIACQILPEGGLVIEGKDFREYREQDRMDKADKIYVMGNSDPSDRLLLMQYLKKKGNVVVALGSRTNDTPMLREADLGVAMGTWSSQMASESSDLVVFDGSLSSLLIVKSCGRCTYHNIQKYIQLELVTNIAGTLIASITTMSLGSNSITGIQLFWANLLTTLVAGPALLMEPPKTELMQKAPIRPTEPLISKPMWRNIVIQAIYQTTILVTFQFKGRALLGFININKQHAVSKSMTFNSFVLCQIFNQVNSRELEKINVLKGIHRNPWFSLAVVFILGLQVSFNEVAHILVGDERLYMAQWCVCLLIGAISYPVDLAAKCVWNLVKNRHFGVHNRSATMTHSASLDTTVSVRELELPLIDE